jgi:hypothetical protein
MNMNMNMNITAAPPSPVRTTSRVCPSAPARRPFRVEPLVTNNMVVRIQEINESFWGRMNTAGAGAGAGAAQDGYAYVNPAHDDHGMDVDE